MASTPAEIMAKKIASKQKQVDLKLVQLAKTLARKAAKQLVLDGYLISLATETIPKKVSSLTKKKDSAIIQITKYDATIERYEAKRLAYAQQLYELIHPR